MEFFLCILIEKLIKNLRTLCTICITILIFENLSIFIDNSCVHSQKKNKNMIKPIYSYLRSDFKRVLYYVST